MHTIDLYAAPGTPTRSFTFPSKWNELSAEQLPKLAMLLSVLTDEDDARVVILQTLSGMPGSAFAEPNGIPYEDLCMVTEATDSTALKVTFLPQLDWCFQPPDLSPEQPGPAKSLLPSITLPDGTITYAGPGDGLDNFSFDRFVWVDSLFQQLVTEPNDQHMNNWLGAAYQPEGTTWNSIDLEKHAEQLATLPTATKLAALLNYRGLRAACSALYPSVFSSSAEAGPGTSLGLFGMVYDVADGGVFGAVPLVRQTLMHEVLGYVQHTNEKSMAPQPTAPAEPTHPAE